ncbi:hypothetical protein SAMN05444266_102186 [Chitinophaga jiangningensis]|uniref:Uncharacterized protein n=2 Tax=Chitinophaga jiangningensis TaxID=1419482 RepID=A0A1M6Y837_9BACT|nr:hypothetical protein SAMN05444266_102186 [Chitinophaga jiangningensis]
MGPYYSTPGGKQNVKKYWIVMEIVAYTVAVLITYRYITDNIISKLTRKRIVPHGTTH